MTAMLGFACLVVISLLGLLVVYQWILAAASALPERPRRRVERAGHNRFVVLIPAHNEEAGLRATLDSLAALAYPADRVRTVVIADRCDDDTARVAQLCGVRCLERAGGPAGKGAAIAWAIDQLRRDEVYFDGLVIVDADTLADPRLLEALGAGLDAGFDVQQGYNYLSNPWESPFTRIIAVTAILRNRLFYGGKARLGLLAMLTGTGMCFSRRILQRHRWDAFSVGEDWEFSASLLLSGETIHFNAAARVLARESSGLKQASSQRLRWSSGRHAVAATGGRALFAAGIRQRSLALCDAALNLAAPTYSAQAAIAILCLAVSWFVASDSNWAWLPALCTAVTTLLVAYFLVGVALTESPLRALGGIVLIPVFLPWRITIEVLGLLGYGRKQWVRTSRVPARH